MTFDQISAALTILTRMVASALWLVIALIFLALIMAVRMRRKKQIARQMRASILDALYETQCHTIAAPKQALVESEALVLGVPNSDRLFSRQLDQLVRRGKVRRSGGNLVLAHSEIRRIAVQRGDDPDQAVVSYLIAAAERKGDLTPADPETHSAVLSPVYAREGQAL